MKKTTITNPHILQEANTPIPNGKYSEKKKHRERNTWDKFPQMSMDFINNHAFQQK